MKRNLRTDKKPRLSVRVEHIRTLVASELARLSGHI